MGEAKRPVFRSVPFWVKGRLPFVRSEGGRRGSSRSRKGTFRVVEAVVLAVATTLRAVFFLDGASGKRVDRKGIMYIRGV